jgi:hypothetical protein
VQSTPDTSANQHNGYGPFISVPFAFLATVLVISSDFFTGEHVSFRIVGLLPMAICGFRGSMVSGWCLALALSAYRPLFAFLYWPTKVPVGQELWSASVALCTLLFALYASEFAATRLQDAHRILRVLSTTQSDRAVLNVCHTCQRIEGSDGAWMTPRVLKFSDSVAEPVICPICAAAAREVLPPEPPAGAGRPA